VPPSLCEDTRLPAVCPVTGSPSDVSFATGLPPVYWVQL